MSNDQATIGLVPGAVLVFQNGTASTRTVFLRTEAGGYIQAALPPGGRIAFLEALPGTRVDVQVRDGDIIEDREFAQVVDITDDAELGVRP